MVDETFPDYVVQACMAKDIGLVRETNQDAIAFVSPGDPGERRRRGVLAIVADGMGGHKGGEVASALAVQTVCRDYFAAPVDDPLQAIGLAMAEANETVYRAAEADRALSGMGTTATALVLVGGNVLFAHVGDSRLYRCHQGQARQLTEDDTLVEQMVKEGMITAAEARHHPERNVLVRSLGTRPEVRITTRRCDPPKIGECFVLCSDGMYDSIKPEEIARIVEAGDPETACRQLIELARERDGSDNISVGIVAVRTPDTAEKSMPVTREMVVGQTENK
ncbi:Stp1/IreP family PP2C-type Ser/Thr phosphatase [Accumulibacter sp.]|uniref:Stp1/IreP family PP2C-type Ser/Thr phosphatase n=1 Tax=Accumulibacter sp. TaxID=2053492 RepID=UPI00262E37D8|nr:Stp1/IreP family PP2C-type Ser/Thr phosphatase [Accumulibacter sp.]